MRRTQQILVLTSLSVFLVVGIGVARARKSIIGIAEASPATATVCPWTYCAAKASKQAPVQVPAGRLEFPGFSILPPRGTGWTLLPSEDALHAGYDVMFRKVIGAGEFAHAYAVAHRSASGYAAPAKILRTMLDQAIRARGRVFKTSDDILAGATCVRWEMTHEPDTPMPRFEHNDQATLVSRYEGYLCSHPDAPNYVIEIGYFETTRKQRSGAMLPEESGSFLKALAFTPLGVKVSQFSVARESRGIVIADDALWVTQEGAGTLCRIDPKTGASVATIRVGERPEGFAGGLGSIWVPNWTSGTVSRIDPKTNRLVATIPVGSGPSDIAVADGSIWVTNEKDSSVSRLAPGTNRVADIIHTDGRPVAIAAGAGALWVENFETDEVWRIDPKLNRVAATIRVGRGRHLFAFGNNAVWVSNAKDNSVSRIDPSTNQVVATVPVGSGPMGMALAGGIVWVANFGDSTIIRIDPYTNQSKGRPIPVAESPFFLSSNGRSLWVLSEWGHWDFNTLSRIDF